MTLKGASDAIELYGSKKLGYDTTDATTVTAAAASASRPHPEGTSYREHPELAYHHSASTHATSPAATQEVN